MRYNKEKLSELKKENKDFYDYIMEYVDQIEALHATFLEVEIPALKNGIETHVYYFDIKDDFKEDKEILNRDDDSQPHNSYRIYFGSLIVYETRFL